ncbi:MAG: D-alanyl-D-alanine carboxypeptidase family protein, partial [Anaerovorax sp.]
MSNSAEDGKLSTVEYQEKLATGISTGIMTYFQEKETVAPRQKLEKNNSPIAVRVNNYMKKYPGMGQQEALWKIKLNLDKPEFVQAKVLTKEELASSIVIVNKRYRVPDDYKPNDLVSLTGRVSLRAEAKTAFDQMTAAAKSQGYRITPVSGYRSVAYQHCLYQCYLRSDSRYIVDTYSARAGFSEHHTGMAIDVAGSNGSMSNFGATKEFAWVKENASRYGFIIRYLPDTQYITGYKNEPWHLRYVGTAVAEEMKAQRIKTLEEYVGKFLW